MPIKVASQSDQNALVLYHLDCYFRTNNRLPPSAGQHQHHHLHPAIVAFTLLSSLRSHPLVWAFLAAALVRIFVFSFSSTFEFRSETGALVSPFEVVGIDINFYLNAKSIYFSGSASEALERIKDNFLSGRHELSGPGLPFVLFLFGYEEGNTFPLAFFYLILSIGLCFFWQVWLRDNGVSLVWIFVFALVPNPIWYTINVSTDLIFACIFAAIYYSLQKNRLVTAFALILVSILFRSHGLALMLFFFVYVAITTKALSLATKQAAGLIGLAMIAVSIPVHWPNFLAFTQHANTLNYYAFTQGEYLDGVFDGLPIIFDHLLSGASLLIAKVLYAVGLRPSYSGVDIVIVLIRAAPGLLLLPGLVYMCWRGRRVDQLLVSCMLLPVLLGAAQERYILSFLPILFFYGTQAITEMARLTKRAKMSAD